ncbi:MAG: metallophosphoesterase [Sarcina sp.]
MKFIKVILVLIVIALYGWLNYFVGASINHDLINSFGINIDYIIWAIFIVGTICTVLIYGFYAKSMGTIVGKVGIYAFGFSTIAFFLIVITNAIAKLMYKGQVVPKYFSMIQIAIIILVFVYGRYNVADTKIRNYDIKLDKKSNLDKLNVVLISDVHLGYFNDNKRFNKNVERINSLKPDIVVIAGDLFDQNFASLQKNEETKKIFEKIKSKYGVYLCFGNHDSGPTYKDMKNFVDDSCINLLEDKAVTFDGEFIIAGRRDLTPMGYRGEARDKNWNAKLDKELPIIVLEHQPSYKEYDSSIDLILSGHTHKGQIFPFSLVTKRVFVNDYGYKKLDNGIHTVVTSGLGTWGPPVRIGSKNEIVQINVEFSK